MVVACSALLFVACGGSSAPAASKCVPGQSSVPNMAGDPCRQDNPACLAIGGKGIAPCGTDSAWGQCVCMTPPGAGATGQNSGAVTMVSACGNGIIEADKGEQCEQGMTGNTTCASLLGMGAQGIVNCVACKLDMTTCMLPPAMVAAAAPTGGTGATGQGGAGH
jgi:hypothetical protein